MSEPEKPAPTCATCPYFEPPASPKQVSGMCHHIHAGEPDRYPYWWCSEHPLIQAKARRMAEDAYANAALPTPDMIRTVNAILRGDP